MFDKLNPALFLKTALLGPGLANVDKPAQTVFKIARNSTTYTPIRANTRVSRNAGSRGTTWDLLYVRASRCIDLAFGDSTKSERSPLSTSANVKTLRGVVALVHVRGPQFVYPGDHSHSYSYMVIFNRSKMKKKCEQYASSCKPSVADQRSRNWRGGVHGWYVRQHATTDDGFVHSKIVWNSHTFTRIHAKYQAQIHVEQRHVVGMYWYVHYTVLTSTSGTRFRRQ